ncbi:MAG: hypothetical protein K0R50_2443 [Eubacterium sp.]|nr:hypothetical protein [Eubacterium sp.]
MEIQEQINQEEERIQEEVIIQEKIKPKKSIAKKKLNLDKDSLQFNAQDLDQEQKVDLKPVQLNSQNVQLIVGSITNNYSGKITGTTYRGINKEIASNVVIHLYFGFEHKIPVYKTKSDTSGNFIIEDLPSGYYTLVAELGDKLKYQTHYIKVLPCQNVNQSILL